MPKRVASKDVPGDYLLIVRLAHEQPDAFPGRVREALALARTMCPEIRWHDGVLLTRPAL